MFAPKHNISQRYQSANVSFSFHENEGFFIVKLNEKEEHHRDCDGVLLFGAPEPVSEEKTVNSCFFERCPTKQGAEEASVSSDTQRLCDSDIRTHVSNVELEFGGSHKRKTTPYGVVFFYGAPSGIRTRDPLIKSQLLYQLS